MDALWRRKTFNKYLELRGREEDEAVYARLEVLEIIQEMGEVDELINYIFDKYVRDEGAIGTFDEFIAQVKETHGGTKHEREYLAALELAKIVLEVE